MKPEQLRRWFDEQFRGKTIYERLFNVLKVPSADRVQTTDLQRVAQILLKLHPGLQFLAETPQF